MGAAMPREVLEARIVRERRELALALTDLRERAHAELGQLDLRHRVRERPTAWLAGALVVGVFLGARR